MGTLTAGTGAAPNSRRFVCSEGNFCREDASGIIRCPPWLEQRQTAHVWLIVSTPKCLLLFPYLSPPLLIPFR